MFGGYRLRKISCNLCGSNEYKQVADERGFTVCSCRKCGLLYVNPQPYDWLSTDSSESYPYYENEGSLDEIPSKYLPALKSALKMLGSMHDVSHSPSLLDIGCGIGLFLELAIEQGWDAYGQDISEIACRHAGEVIGFERVFCSRLEELSTEQRFDVCTLWCVLEHVEDPMQLLRATFDLLKPNGTIMIRVPNTGGGHRILSIFKRMIGKPPSSRLGGVPTHLFGYNSMTIKRYLLESGFNNARLCKTEASGYQGPALTLINAISKASTLITGGRYTIGPILAIGKKDQRRL